jgi:preprotein translocase subunit SecA
MEGYEQREARFSAPRMRQVERDLLLQTLDQHWRDHLAGMDYLRQGIHLRGYAQKDYRYEYKREAFELFTALLSLVKFETVSILSRVEIRSPEQLEREEAERRERLMRQLQAQHAEAQSMLAAAEPPPPAAPGLDTAAGAMVGTVPFVRGDRKVGRNEMCPCGSGKKFKHCHGALAEGQ